MEVELVSHPTDAERVLRALQLRAGEYVADLYRTCGCMIHSRVSDLRRAGHLIECKRFGAKDYRYRLVA